MNDQPLPGLTPEQIAQTLVTFLYQKGASDIKLYSVSGETTLTDYQLIATGRSSTHVRALADEADEQMSLHGVNARALEGVSGGSWILLDFWSVIVHIFAPVARDYYRLERLQKPEAEVDISRFLTAPVSE